MSVEILTAFVNTRDLESGADALGTAASAGEWLENNGLADGRVSADGAARLRDVREALRRVLLANNGGGPDPAAVEVLRDAARDAPLRIAFGADGVARLEPAVTGAGAAIGRLLAAVERAQAEGEWKRLKACAAEDCHWAFYDKSRNRSRTWCSMEVCGNRAKARSYRARAGD